MFYSQWRPYSNETDGIREVLPAFITDVLTTAES